MKTRWGFVWVLAGVMLATVAAGLSSADSSGGEEALIAPAADTGTEITPVVTDQTILVNDEPNGECGYPDSCRPEPKCTITFDLPGWETQDPDFLLGDLLLVVTARMDYCGSFPKVVFDGSDSFGPFTDHGRLPPNPGTNLFYICGRADPIPSLKLDVTLATGVVVSETAVIPDPRPLCPPGMTQIDPPPT